MSKKLASILPWVVVGVLFLSVKLHWLPAYFSHLLSGILLLWWFLEIYGKRRKNPDEKLDWFERFDLFFLPLASLIAFYTFFTPSGFRCRTSKSAPRQTLARGGSFYAIPISLF